MLLCGVQTAIVVQVESRLGSLLQRHIVSASSWPYQSIASVILTLEFCILKEAYMQCDRIALFSSPTIAALLNEKQGEGPEGFQLDRK
jgi:hypothetical protein